jgi:DNA-directed RNA polymerase specialized sigma24 family protein
MADETPTNYINALRAARRSKPPSLKKQALQALAEAIKMADDTPPEGICSDQADIIRRALEQLPDNE